MQNEPKRKLSPVQFIVRTGALIAIAALFQIGLRLLIGDAPWTKYLISSLVNLTLAVAACSVGLTSGLIVALVTPLVALMYGAAVPPLVPAIMLGNAVFVLGMWATRRVPNDLLRYLLIVIVSALKFFVIAGGMAMFVPAASGKGFAFAAAQQLVQLITAIIGGAIGLHVARAVNRALK